MLEKRSINHIAARLTQPFLMAGIAGVGYHRLSVYSCLGAMGWHRHLDEDEVFLGHTGTLTLETSWGDVALPPGHLIRIPKGLPHRSYAAALALALLVQTDGLPNRRNGHQPPSNPGSGRLGAVSVADQAARLINVYHPRRLAVSDGLALSVQVCLGAQDWHRHDGEQLVLCYQGHIAVEAQGGQVTLAPGELTLVEAGAFHRVVAAEPATAVTMAEIL